MKAEQACSYSSMQGFARPTIQIYNKEETFKIKAKRIVCPECGRKVWSSVRSCDDGCCIFHCIPPHKKKGWWKKGKKQSRRIK
jgi:hypothetical protein